MAATGSFLIMVLCVIHTSQVYKVVWSPSAAEDFVWVAKEKSGQDRKAVVVTYATCSL